MREKIIAVISKVSKISENELIKNFAAEKLWDSLKHIEVVLVLEEEFGVMFEREEIALMRSVKNIEDILLSKGVKQ